MKSVVARRFVLLLALGVLLVRPVNLEAVECFLRGFQGEVRIDYSVPAIDGSYLAFGAGPDLSPNSSDLYVVKFDAKGRIGWSKAYDMGGTESPMGVIRTSDGNFVVTVTSGSQIYALKMNALGAIIWRKKLEFGNLGVVISMTEMSDGGILLVGDTGFDNGLLVKLDRFGKVLWAKSCGGESDDMFTAAAKNTDNTIALAGVLNVSASYAMPSANWFSKLDNSGRFIWSQAVVFGDAWFNSANAAIAAPNGATIFGGYFDNGDSENDGYLVKMGQKGGVVWQEAFGTPQSDQIFTGHGVDQGILLAGNTGNENSNGFLVKFDLAGAITLQKVFGGPRQDEIDRITPLEGGFLISGVALSFNAQSFMAVLNQNGTLTGCSTFRNGQFTVKPVTVSVSTPQFTITPINVRSVDVSVRTRKVTIQSRSICR